MTIHVATVCPSAPADLPIPALVEQCRTGMTTERDADRDDRFGLELFRRAVVDGDEQAWVGLIEVYQRLVTLWCARAGAAEGDLDGSVNAAWAKFWRSYTAAKFARTDSLPAVLAYLKLCSRSVVFDAARGRAPQRHLDEVAEVEDEAPTPEACRIAVEGRESLWQIVAAHVRDERERVLVALTYELGLRPAEVQARRPDLFPTVADVYRQTRNLLDRLRRDATLREWRSAN